MITSLDKSLRETVNSALRFTCLLAVRTERPIRIYAEWLVKKLNSLTLENVRNNTLINRIVSLAKIFLSTQSVVLTVSNMRMNANAPAKETVKNTLKVLVQLKATALLNALDLLIRNVVLMDRLTKMIVI